MRFQEGDRVQWEGKKYQRTGQIVAVVPAHTNLNDALAAADLPGRYRNYIFRTKPRPHESYIVVTPAPSERKCPGVYWPRPNTLSKVV